MDKKRRVILKSVITSLIAGSVFSMTHVAYSKEQTTFPEKQIRIIVPYSAGGGTDIIARHLAERLRKRTNKVFIVENKPGANGVIGTNFVAKSEPDGATLLLVVSTHLLNPLLMKSLPYDTFKDLTPITKVATSPMAIVIRGDAPEKSVHEYAEKMRKNPERYAYGSSENMTRLIGAMFIKAMGVDIVHIPYKGGSPLITDVMSGTTSIGITSVLAAKQFIESQKLKALAVTGAQRVSMMPDVPTMMESGAKGFEAYSDYTMFAPSATPRPMLELIQREISAVLRSSDMEAVLAAQAATPGGDTVSRTEQQVAKDFQFWKRLVEEVGLKAE